jgi:predicted TPR repeat methyltransferase
MSESSFNTSGPDADRRQNILLSEIPEGPYQRVLHVGCGEGFLTSALPGREIIGVDASAVALSRAMAQGSTRVRFEQAALLQLGRALAPAFDLIVLTDVLDAAPARDALPLAYLTIDQLLAAEGIVVSLHADAGYRARLPYLLLRQHLFEAFGATHRLEVYAK